MSSVSDPPDHTPLASEWDVVVIGSGAAGLMTCLELPAGLRVLLLAKSALPPSASRWAQGGIAAVTQPDDSFASHIADTLRAGAGLCDPQAVELLVTQAPACVERLLKLGMEFDRDQQRLSTTLEAAHSHRRVLHAQDRTGGALVDALERQVRLRPGLTQRKGMPALRLWLEGGRCVGLQVLDGHQLRWLRAGAVVLASGGGGHLYAHTTNPAQASGDGVAMAWSAGAAVRNLEFVQFHPTALMLPGAPHFLISEAVRGEGARLCDADGASPVASLAGGDLAPRDQVSRALARRMQELGVDHLWLDLRPVGRERLERQFPTILGRCRDLGLEPTEAPIPVAPAAHYWMGGVGTDLNSATNLPGLYAVGEVACTGVHGANRLASNSLMECLVFARQLANLQIQPVPTQPAHEPCYPLVAGAGHERQVDSERLQQSIISLRQRCWQVAGVERQGPSLRRALGRIQGQRQELESLSLWRCGAELAPGNRIELDPRQLQNLSLLHELRQRLVLAQLLVEAAGFRQESRGGHFRTDAPAAQPFWQRETVQAKGQAIRTRPLNEAAGVQAVAQKAEAGQAVA
ncbi:MAG: L-aspartate oxidase [Synechococcaceae cyanobacterium]|nr:L-aspartate oxidase [Synechococcaceae cyanobacterium]